MMMMIWYQLTRVVPDKIQKSRKTTVYVKIKKAKVGYLIALLT